MVKWFWTKFSFLILLIGGVISFLLPSSFLSFVPSWNNFVQSHPVVLGIDLAGGTKLEYKIDFSQAIQKAKLSGQNLPENVINKEQISAGVVKTLKKRIDPDGTKEISVFASQRAEDWFVVVELTKDVDTPENRASLQKVTSLSFKEPYTDPKEAKASAQIILDQAIQKKTSLEEFSFNLVSGEEALVSTSETGFTQKTLIELIGLKNTNILWETKEHDYFIPTVLEFNEKQYFFFVKTPVSKNINNEDIILGTLLEYSPRWKETALGGGQFTVAKLGTDPNTNSPVANIEFTSEGAILFGQITEKLSHHSSPLCGGQGDVFAIFVDGKLVSDPCVREKISGNAQISFGSTKGTNFQSVQSEAQKLVENLNSGATPAPVDLIAEQTISATLGETALYLSLKAFLIGFAILSLWIIWSYRFFGILAVVALAFYSVAILVIFRMTGFVLTLSGIAGIVLSVGMAVDANILIFERTREEFALGKTFQEAVLDGFERAWTSIRDSNTSSLITCFILWAVGTSIIKAFAITLSVGILLSLFTAITLTRYFIWAFTPKILKSNQKYLLGE